MRVRTVHVHRPTLDDVFLHYTGRQIRDEHAEHVLPARARARMARALGGSDDTTALDLPGRPLADERESLAEELRTVGMVWEREAIRFFRTRARVLSSFIQPVLFLFVLGYGMSTLVGSTAGFDFKKFLFPGIVAMTVMSTALSSAISIVWDREFGFLREMLVAPVSRTALVSGKTLGGASIATVQGTIMLALAPLIGVRLTRWWWWRSSASSC